MPLLHTGQFFGQGSGGGGGGDPHRYWRLYFHMEATNQDFITIAEVELRQTIGGADATGGGTASADTDNGALVAAGAFDNDTATRWSSTATALPHWLAYDFGAGNEKDINEVAITHSDASVNGAARDWSLQYSDDNIGWNTKWSIYGENSWAISEQRIYSDPGAPALYVYPGITDAHDILGSAMRGWYAADRITGSNGDAQAYWHDISGQGFYLRQFTSALRPTLAAADLNGLNTVRFTAADTEQMLIPNPVMAGVSAASAYLVYKANADPAAASTSAGLWTIGTAASADHLPFTDSNVYSGFASTARKSAGNPTPSLASWRIIGLHSAASDYGIHIDGVSFFSTGTNTVAIIARPTLGKSVGTVYLNGWIAEAIFTNAKQSSGDREKVEGYLAHKWGLTGNLDAGHPYKSSPP